jgi:predicted flap endonuclease-1-like 5' DNA nuclease
MRLGTIPPSRMPKPSDPPPPRAATSPPERQRIAQMETQLDQTLSAIAQKKSELDELRARLEEKEQRLDALLDRLPSEPGTAPARADGEPELDRRLRDLEQKKEEIARELRVRFSAQEEDTEKHIALLDTLSNRLQWLEEGEEAARIRMRLERVGHRLTGLESKLVEIAESQDDLRTEEAGRAARDRKWEARIERLESLFDEMADELRTQRDGSEVEALRARLEGVEALVLQTGSAEQALKLEVEALRGSIAPPPRSAPAEPPVKEAPVTSAAPSSAAPTSAAMSGDDLTRIKGVGPKFARQLRGLGITTFAQVAAWGADDVELIAAELGIKPTRIARAGWVKSAKALID